MFLKRGESIQDVKYPSNKCFREERKSSTNCLNFPESHYTVLNTIVAKTIYFKAHNHEISEHYSIKKKLFCILPMNFFQRKKSVTYKKSGIKRIVDLTATLKTGKQKNSKEIYFQPRILYLNCQSNMSTESDTGKEVKNSSSRMLMKRESRNITTHKMFSSVQSLSLVRLFAIPWTAACQASLSISNSWSLLRLMSIKSMMPHNNLILYCPLPLPPSIFFFNLFFFLFIFTLFYYTILYRFYHTLT